MLELAGKLATARFINRPIFIVGASRSGTIVLLKAMGRHTQILSTPSEDPFITDIGGMVHSLEFCDEVERQYYRETLRISQDYLYGRLRRLALESALGPHFGLRYLATRVGPTVAFNMPQRAALSGSIPSPALRRHLHYITLLLLLQGVASASGPELDDQHRLFLLDISLLMSVDGPGACSHQRADLRLQAANVLGLRLAGGEGLPRGPSDWTVNAVVTIPPTCTAAIPLT